jgi:hypothetical protein
VERQRVWKTMLITIFTGVVASVIAFWATDGLKALVGNDNGQVTPEDKPGSGGLGTGGATNGPTTGQPPTTTTPPPPTSAPAELSFVDRVAGTWTLKSWTEKAGPVTLYIQAERGTLTVKPDRDVDWRLDIDERAENNTPQPAIACGGRLNLSNRIEPVRGGDRNSDINWTADLQSVDRSSTGQNHVRRALCGWTNDGHDYPYTVKIDGASTQKAKNMELTNAYGTFIWTR